MKSYDEERKTANIAKVERLSVEAIDSIDSVSWEHSYSACRDSARTGFCERKSARRDHEASHGQTDGINVTCFTH